MITYSKIDHLMMMMLIGKILEENTSNLYDQTLRERYDKNRNLTDEEVDIIKQNGR